MEYQEMDFEKAQDTLRQSWEVHRQAFGPILEPAFAENPEARIHLTAALNCISRRDIKKGMELLKKLRPACAGDEDMAAWCFFVGLGFEMAGSKEQMMQWYGEAGKYGHSFYLPYMKLAKAEHGQGRLEEAAEHYARAIGCLLDMDESEREDVILGSGYTNLCSCLTMLHRYKEAEQAWLAAQSYPAQPAAPATAAIMYAAMGDEEKTAAYLRELEEKLPPAAGQIRAMTRAILDGEHPQFPPKRNT